MTFDFNNKTVLITGSSRGIGAVTANRFAAAGAKVILHYNQDSKRAETIYKSLQGSEHYLLQGNFSTPEASADFCTRVISSHPKIDILVNNAGIYKPLPMIQANADDWYKNWQETISVNLDAAAMLCFAVGKEMVKNGSGKIINVTSRGAFRGEPNALAYGASKAGLNALSQSLAVALAPHNVFVFAVAPGFVETEMSAEQLEGTEGIAIRAQSPLNRVAKPEEVAHTILMLASEGSDFMTGSIIDINGASYLR